MRELLTWHNTYTKDGKPDLPLTNLVYKNVDSFIKRAGLMGFCAEEKDKVCSFGRAKWGIAEWSDSSDNPVSCPSRDRSTH